MATVINPDHESVHQLTEEEGHLLFEHAVPGLFIVGNVDSTFSNGKRECVTV